jgi:hypothetical protein
MRRGKGEDESSHGETWFAYMIKKRRTILAEEPGFKRKAPPPNVG